MIDRINNLKQRLQDSKVSKGCIHYFPDELKQEALLLHLESKLSLRKFAPMIGSCPRTMKTWRDYFGMQKPIVTCPNFHRMLEPDVMQVSSRSKNVKPKKESFIKISDAETRESVLAKKIIRNKARYDKLKLETKVSKTQVIVSKPKEEVSDDIKVYLEKSINKAIPVVRTQGDIIPQKFRDMQAEWLSKHKPKRYVNGILIED